MQIEFAGGLRSTQTISCAGGVLQTDSYVDMSRGSSISVRTISSSGEYLPRNVEIGSTWTQTFNLEIRPNIGGGSTDGIPTMHAQTTLTHEALRTESVTVPAGTYNAIVVKTKIQTNIDAPGTTTPAPAPLPSIELVSFGWWVRGVGLVKSETNMGGGLRATSEAETVVVP